MAFEIFGLCQLTLSRCRMIRVNAVSKLLSHQVNNCSRVFSTTICVRDKSDDSSWFRGSTGRGEELEQRGDLKQLKKLLFQGKPRPPTPATDLRRRDRKTKESQAKHDQRKPSVNMGKFKDILYFLKRGSPSESVRAAEIPPSTVNERNPKKHQIKTLGKAHVADTKSSPVNLSKIKDALSHLGQENSSSPTDDVVLTGRYQQVSSNSLAAMEGAYHIKQRQIHDKDKKKKMTRHSLRNGPRFHWFDEVKTKWPSKKLISTPSLFQEMAEKEIYDLGRSGSVQTGFRDLIENAHRQWAFPIDNECCKTEEQDVGFDEHVFLEHFLDEFPETGNIRQFMELVIIGLQQNPYLNVQEKKEHILWFKEYFKNIPDEYIQI